MLVGLVYAFVYLRHPFTSGDDARDEETFGPRVATGPGPACRRAFWRMFFRIVGCKTHKAIAPATLPSPASTSPLGSPPASGT